MKPSIQKLSYDELNSLFQQLAMEFNIPFQKLVKEISYKCHEAMWIVPYGKALGYGRNQHQSYHQALLNLFDILLENDSFANYVRKQLKQCGFITQNANNDYIHKTEENDYENHGRFSLNYSKSKSSLNNSTNQKLKITQYSPLKNITNFKDRKDVHYSKIVLNKSSHTECSTNNTKNNVSNQLHQAKQKLKKLLLDLEYLNTNNMQLRRQIQQVERNQNCVSSEQSLKSNDTFASNHTEGKQSCKKPPKPFVMVPKLKLQVLPNYHKKSEKSLNESLLNAYNQKYNKKIPC